MGVCVKVIAMVKHCTMTHILTHGSAKERFQSCLLIRPQFVKLFSDVLSQISSQVSNRGIYKVITHDLRREQISGIVFLLRWWHSTVWAFTRLTQQRLLLLTSWSFIFILFQQSPHLWYVISQLHCTKYKI